MRFVARKSEERLDMQTLHRVRDRLVAERTSLMNQIRSLLLERGIVVPQGRAKLDERLSELRQSPDQVSPCIQLLLGDLHDRLAEITARIRAYDAEFTAQAQANERARRLMAIPGIGALNATALVAAVGKAKTFGRGRDLAAWLGLVPRQATIGGRPKLLGITKRGEPSTCAKCWSRGRGPQCRFCNEVTRGWTPGCARSWRGLVPTLPWWRWPPGWRGPSGHCRITDEATRRPRP